METQKTLIDDAAHAVETKEVRGLNEPWTHDPGSFTPPEN